MHFTLSHVWTLSDASAAATFVYIVKKGEIAHGEQFFFLPLCFQLYLISKPLFIEIYHVFANLFSKSSAAVLFVCG